MLTYAAQFTVKKTISEAFGSCPISKLKRIANALQLPTAGDLIRCIKSEGFYGQAKEFEKYEIKVNRATVSEILEDANNCPTLYSVAKSYNGSTSNYYSFLNRESDVTLSYISSKLPKDYDIAEILDLRLLIRHIRRYVCVICNGTTSNNCYFHNPQPP